MFNRFSRSWELVKTSFDVIRQDKELLIFPIMSMIALALVSITFFIPMTILGLFTGDNNPLLVLFGFVYYVIVYYIGIFANAAIVGATMKRLNGQDPTFSDALNIAMSRSGKIFGWAMVAATVGLALNALQNFLEERAGFAGAIIGSIASFAWGVATFLVVPVLVIENLGPIDAVKRSSSLLKRTWGEQVIGNFGIGLVFFLLFLAGGLPLLLITIATASISPILAVFFGIILGLYVLFLIALSTAVNGIFTAAVYAYATQSTVANPIFERDLIEHAFVTKPNKRVML